MVYYFDYGATSLKKPETVAKKVYEILSSAGYANPSRGSYKEANDAFREVYQTRKTVADFFGLADESRVIFTNNATESLNIAIHGIVNEGDHIITTALEHNSVLRPIYLASSTKNITYTVIGIDKNANLRYDDIEKAITNKTKAVIVTHSSNVTGNIVNIEKIAEICKKHGIVLIVDAAQTAGVIDINIDKMGIDILCFTGHKSLFAPQGIGGLCINLDEPKLKRFKVGGSGVETFNKKQPSAYPLRLEAGTLNLSGIAGLRQGIEYINSKGIENLRKKQVAYAEKFYNDLKDLESLQFYGDFSKAKTAVVAFNIVGVASGDVADTLFEDYNIAVRAGNHCAPLLHDALGTREQGIVRFSFSSMNTEEEIDYAIKAVEEIVEQI